MFLKNPVGGGGISDLCGGGHCDPRQPFAVVPRHPLRSEEPGSLRLVFKRIPPRLPTADCLTINELTLLYVGISPKLPPKNGGAASRQTLWSRLRYHMRGTPMFDAAADTRMPASWGIGSAAPGRRRLLSISIHAACGWTRRTPWAKRRWISRITRKVPRSPGS